MNAQFIVPTLGLCISTSEQWFVLNEVCLNSVSLGSAALLMRNANEEEETRWFVALVDGRSYEVAD